MSGLRAKINPYKRGKLRFAPFVDTDLYRLETTSLTVADVVINEAWEGFRRRESEVRRCVP